MLQEFSSQPIHFVTYSGKKDLSQVEIGKYTITGIDSKGVKNTLSNDVILFAFSTESMSSLKPYIKNRTPLKTQNLKPVKIHNNRFQVADKLLTQVKMSNSIVKAVTRSGNVIRGLIQHFDKSVLYMLVGESEVIVYRHGLYEFSIEE